MAGGRDFLGLRGLADRAGVSLDTSLGAGRLGRDLAVVPSVAVCAGISRSLRADFIEAEEIDAGVLQTVGRELAAVIFNGLIVVAVISRADADDVIAAVGCLDRPEAEVALGLVGQVERTAGRAGREMLSVLGDEVDLLGIVDIRGDDHGVFAHRQDDLAADHRRRCLHEVAADHGVTVALEVDHILMTVLELFGLGEGVDLLINVEKVGGRVVHTVGGEAAVIFQRLIVDAAVGRTHVHDVIAAVHCDRVPLAAVGQRVGHAQAVAGRSGGHVLAVGIFQREIRRAVVACAGRFHGENCVGRIGGDVIADGGRIGRGKLVVRADRSGRGHDRALACVVQQHLLPVGEAVDLLADDAAVQILRNGRVAAVGQLPLPSEEVGRVDALLLVVGLIAEELHDEVLHNAAAHVVGLRPDGVRRAVLAEAAARVAEVVVVHADDVGLVEVKVSAVGKAVDDGAGALGLIHIILEVQAAEDRVGEVLADRGVAHLAVADGRLQMGRSVLLQNVLDLLAGQREQIKVVVIPVHPVNVLHRDLAGRDMIAAVDDDRRGGHIDVDVVEAGLLVERLLLLIGVVLLSQMLRSLEHLRSLDQIHRVALLEVVVRLAVPRADGLTGDGVDIFAGEIGIGLDHLEQRGVGLVVIELQIFGGLHGDGILRDGENGLGQISAAAVDDQHVLAVLILIIVTGIAGGMVVTGDHQVDIGVLRDDAQNLILGVDAEGQLAVSRAQTGVEHDRDEVAALCLHLGDVAGGLLGHVSLGVIAVGEAEAGVVLGDVPTGAVRRDHAQQADLDGALADGQLLGDVRSHGVLVLGMDAVGAVVVQVGADGCNAALCHVSTDLGHQVPAIVELVVADVGHIIADLGQTQRHGCRPIALALGKQVELVGGDGRALIEVAVVDKNDVVLVGLAFALHHGCDAEQVVVLVGVVEHVLVPAFAVDVRCGVECELGAVGRLCENRGNKRQQHGHYAQQGKHSLGRLLHGITSQYDFETQ